MHIHVIPVKVALNNGELLSTELAQQLLLLQFLHLLVILPQRLLGHRLCFVCLLALSFLLLPKRSLPFFSFCNQI